MLTGNGSLQLIEFLCLHMLEARRRGVHRVADLRPHASRCCAATARRSSASRSRPTARTSRRSSGRSRSTCRSSSTSIPDFQNPAGATCSAAKRRRLVELAERHGFLLVEDAPYRLLRYRGTRGADALLARAGAHAAHELVHQAHRAGRAHRIHDRRAGADREAGQGRRGHLHLAGLRRAGHHLRVVPARAAAAADRAAEGALRAAPRRLPGRRSTSTCPTRRRRGPTAASSSRSRCPRASARRAVARQAATRALNLADGLAFFPEGGGERFLRLPFCALSPAEIDEGMQRLAEA